MRENILKITPRPDLPGIIIGEHEIKDFPGFISNPWELIKKLEKLELFYVWGSGKERWEDASKKLGMPASKYVGVWNYNVRKAWVEPIEDLLFLAWAGKKRLSTERLKKIHAAAPLLRQAVKDGQRNILPLILVYNKTPRDLREYFGKSCWKRLCGHSFSRNDLISRVHYWLSSNQREDEKRITSLPSTLLKLRKDIRILSIDAHEWIVKNRLESLKYCNTGAWDKWVTLFVDTQDMLLKEGETFNKDWSPRRMQEEHDRISKIITARQFSPEPFESLNWVEQKKREDGEFEIRLLESALEIAEEGRAMGHCVAGYVDRVREGKYLVASIRKGGKRSSTVGYKMEYQYGASTIHQHYASYNDPLVYPKEETKLARDFLYYLDVLKEQKNSLDRRQACVNL